MLVDSLILRAFTFYLLLVLSVRFRLYHPTSVCWFVYLLRFVW